MVFERACVTSPGKLLPPAVPLRILRTRLTLPPRQTLHCPMARRPCRRLRPTRLIFRWRDRAPSKCCAAQENAIRQPRGHMRTRWFPIAFGIAAGTSAMVSAEESAPDAAPNEIVYRKIDGRELRAYSFETPSASAKPRPAIVMVQGGAWSRGTPMQLFRAARYFAQFDLVPVVIEYRLAGGKSSPLESFSDLCHALSFLRLNADQFGISPARIAAWGISSSAQMVAATATVGCDSQGGSLENGGPDALLLVSPVVDAVADGLFRELMRGHGTPASLSPVHTLTRRIAPVLIAQGDADNTTPLARSKAFRDRAQAFGGRCELVILEGQGHVLERASRDRALQLHAEFVRDLWR